MRRLFAKMVLALLLAVPASAGVFDFYGPYGPPPEWGIVPGSKFDEVYRWHANHPQLGQFYREFYARIGTGTGYYGGLDRLHIQVGQWTGPPPYETLGPPAPPTGAPVQVSPPLPKPAPITLGKVGSQGQLIYTGTGRLASASPTSLSTAAGNLNGVGAAPITLGELNSLRLGANGPKIFNVYTNGVTGSLTLPTGELPGVGGITGVDWTPANNSIPRGTTLGFGPGQGIYEMLKTGHPSAVLATLGKAFAALEALNGYRQLANGQYQGAGESFLNILTSGGSGVATYIDRRVMPGMTNNIATAFTNPTSPLPPRPGGPSVPGPVVPPVVPPIDCFTGNCTSPTGGGTPSGDEESGSGGPIGGPGGGSTDEDPEGGRDADDGSSVRNPGSPTSANPPTVGSCIEVPGFPGMFVNTFSGGRCAPNNNPWWGDVIEDAMDAIIPAVIFGGGGTTGAGSGRYIRVSFPDGRVRTCLVLNGQILSCQ